MMEEGEASDANEVYVVHSNRCFYLTNTMKPWQYASGLYGGKRGVTWWGVVVERASNCNIGSILWDSFIFCSDLHPSSIKQLNMTGNKGLAFNGSGSFLMRAVLTFFCYF